MKGYTYILHCSDGSYYTGSTKNIALRLEQHQAGEGANHTRKRLPVKLIYYEEYNRIDEAFYREKQIQGWSRKKKEALIEGKQELLPKLAIAYRDLRTLREPQCPELMPDASRASASGPMPEVLEGEGKGSRRQRKEVKLNYHKITINKVVRTFHKIRHSNNKLWSYLYRS